MGTMGAMWGPNDLKNTYPKEAPLLFDIPHYSIAQQQPSFILSSLERRA